VGIGFGVSCHGLIKFPIGMRFPSLRPLPPALSLSKGARARVQRSNSGFGLGRGFGFGFTDYRSPITVHPFTDLLLAPGSWVLGTGYWVLILPPSSPKRKNLLEPDSIRLNVQKAHDHDDTLPNCTVKGVGIARVDIPGRGKVTAI